MARREQHGDYIAVEGKLDREDSRSAYVTKTFPDGARRPVASFWHYSEAVRWAKEHAEEDERGKEAEERGPQPGKPGPAEA